MRPSALPNLIAAAGRNADRGFADVGLFEVGPQYADDTPAGQAIVAAGIRSGGTGARHWAAERRTVDAFDAKADALASLGACGAPVDKVQVTNDAAPWFHPGRGGTLRLGPKTILAHFGEIHPRILRAMDVGGPIAAFEIFLDAIPKPRAQASRNRRALGASDYPAVDRDFAFVVDDDVAADRIVRAALNADKNLVAGVEVFDVFSGESIGAGKTSVAISVRLQPTDRTLTDAEIEAVSEKIIASVSKVTGASLRG
jgi:phenylalanyl-tRNA synthetase beta chain